MWAGVGRGARGAACGEQHNLRGRLDDLVLLSRALTAVEVASLAASGREYGDWHVPDVQPDLDDVGLTEDWLPHPFTLVGARPVVDRPADLGDEVTLFEPEDERPALGRFGDPGGAWRFEGAGALAAQPWPALGDGDGSFTLELWARVETLGGADQALLQATVGDRFARLLCRSNGRLDFTVRGSGGDATIDRLGHAPCNDGSWRHIVAVRDAVEGELRLYLDGVLVNHIRNIGGDLDLAGATVRLGEGQQADELTGELDEIALHPTPRWDAWAQRRGHSLPRLRFLASTRDAAAAPEEGGGFPRRSYRLWWGDADAGRGLIDGRTPVLFAGDDGRGAWWRFEDRVGAEAPVDVTDNASRAEPDEVGPAPPRPGDLGAAAAFDEVGWMLTDRPASLSSEDWTVEAWVLQEEGRDGLVTDGRDNTFLAGPLLHVGAQGAALCEVGSGTPAHLMLQTEDGVVPRDTWTHVACVKAGRRMTLYVNGDPVEADDLPDDPPIPPAGELMIVGANYAGDGRWPGDLDDVRWMARPLDPAELLLASPPPRAQVGAPAAAAR